MITSAIVDALLAAIQALYGLIPDWQLGTGPDAIDPLIRTVATVNGIIPLRAVAICLAVALVLEGVMLGFDFGMWVWHQFWGAS